MDGLWVWNIGGIIVIQEDAGLMPHQGHWVDIILLCVCMSPKASASQYFPICVCVILVYRHLVENPGRRIIPPYDTYGYISYVCDSSGIRILGLSFRVA
jgi:hypothetical protein